MVSKGEHPKERKLYPFGHFQKGGGVQPKSKTRFLGVPTTSKTFEVVLFKPFTRGSNKCQKKGGGGQSEAIHGGHIEIGITG